MSRERGRMWARIALRSAYYGPDIAGVALARGPRGQN